ncbi:MAG: HAD family phosphatase [Solirubrobacteraceae bacterium]|nr:HAD family phosphatase [Solirubrobacteraceae bacterium]
MIRAIVSDFGGVLTTPLSGSFQSFADGSGVDLETMGQALTALHERDGIHPLHELECGRLSETAFVESLRDSLADLLGRRVELASLADSLWEGLFPNEAMIAFMASLRAEGYRMGLLTNNVREWELKWRAMAPIDDIFELVIDSAFVGVRKPDPEIYELTVTGLGVPAAECLFVDDIEVNCDAAQAAGMTAVVFRDAQQAIAEMRAILAAEGLVV